MISLSRKRIHSSTVLWAVVLLLFLISKFVMPLPFITDFLQGIAYESLFLMPAAMVVFIVSALLIEKLKIQWEPLKDIHIFGIYTFGYYYFGLLLFAFISIFLPSLDEITCKNILSCLFKAVNTEPLLFGLSVSIAYFIFSFFEYGRERAIKNMKDELGKD